MLSVQKGHQDTSHRNRCVCKAETTKGKYYAFVSMYLSEYTLRMSECLLYIYIYICVRVHGRLCHNWVRLSVHMCLCVMCR